VNCHDNDSSDETEAAQESVAAQELEAGQNAVLVGVQSEDGSQKKDIAIHHNLKAFLKKRLNIHRITTQNRLPNTV